MLKILRGDLTTKSISRNSLKPLLLAAFQADPERRHSSFRTSETDPTNHTAAQIAQFYRIPDDVKQTLFQHGGLPKSYQIQAKTFAETCLMVREPYVDAANCIRSIDFAKPTVRFVLYGPEGSGKSLVLAHLVHFAHLSGFLIVHVPWVGNWMRRCKEPSNSLTREGHVDINLDSAAWLLHFKTQNAKLLESPDLVTSEEYVWSKREITPRGVPLVQLVDHGINRIKYSSDCVVFLAREIKNLSKRGLCKTFVAVDGYNAFFHPKTRVRTEKKELVHPHRVTTTEAFLDLTRHDWNNGVCVLTVDQLAQSEEDKSSYLPRYLLGKDGFEHLDPFVPISVPSYSKKELTSCMDYYRERRWVPDLPGLDEELAFLSNLNPYKLMELCAPL